MRVILGNRTLAFDPDPKWESRMSFALFCPHCGDIWGRVQKSKVWYCIQLNCSRHSNEYQIGGSFFQNFEWILDYKGFTRKYPDLARHEFDVAMAWADKFINAGKPAFQQELEI